MAGLESGVDRYLDLGRAFFDSTPPHSHTQPFTSHPTPHPTGPIRELGPQALMRVKADEVRALEERDFTTAVRVVRPR